MTQPFRVFHAMPTLAITTLLAMLLCNWAFFALGFESVGADKHWLLPSLAKIAYKVANVLIIVPVAMRVHRFVLVQEIRDLPVWYLPAGYGRFVLWLLLVQIILGLAIGLVSLGLTDLAGLFPTIPTIKWSLQTIAFLVNVVGTIGTIIVGLRLLILFPAIAVRAADIDWRTAWKRTKGHAWQFCWACLLSGLPSVIILIGVVVVVVRVFPGPTPALTGGNTALFTQAVVSVWTFYITCVTAALASRFYQLYGSENLPPQELSPGG